MSIVFFVSSVGDTDLAIATINTLLYEEFKEPIIVVPLTQIAIDRTKPISSNVKLCSLIDITSEKNIYSEKNFSQDAKIHLLKFISTENIKRAYVGVPSPNDEIFAFQIARILPTPCTIAYEFMFTAPEAHPFWNNINVLSEKGCDFAVPFIKAEQEIHAISPKAEVHKIGHVSIDRAFSNANKVDVENIKKQLQLNEEQELIFASGTTQTTEVDKQFLEALLNGLDQGNHQNMQIRFGIHPGIKNIEEYLDVLLDACDRHPNVSKQIKFIITPMIETILRCNVSGADAASIADKVCQAVPGALLNESVIKGKPTYAMKDSEKSYLPDAGIHCTVSGFFSATGKRHFTKEGVGLKDTAGFEMAKLIKRS
jgi:hypothetical protein